jgi:hypothetical protein
VFCFLNAYAHFLVFLLLQRKVAKRDAMPVSTAAAPVAKPVPAVKMADSVGYFVFCFLNVYAHFLVFFFLQS